MSDATELQPRPADPAPAQSDGAVILAMIDRLTQLPDTPVERFEQIFSLYQKVRADGARKAFADAFASLQAELPTVVAIGRITGEDKATSAKVTRSKYAKWEDVNEAIRPSLSKHGFSLSFRITQPQPDRVQVTAVLTHREGHSEDTSLHLPNDPSGGKNNVQAWGSSISYGKRYTSFALLNIASRGEDDDGKAASATGSVSPEQAEELAKLISATKTDIHRFLEMGEVESLSDIPASQFAAAKAKLLAKQAQMMKGGR